MKIVCDPAAASEAMDTIDQRHEALMGHLWAAIRNGIEAHNTLEQSHGFASKDLHAKLRRVRARSEELVELRRTRRRAGHELAIDDRGTLRNFFIGPPRRYFRLQASIHSLVVRFTPTSSLRRLSKSGM